MPISDSNPERRNLMLSSIAFLVFFWGGGEFEKNEIRIQTVNITFNNETVLAVFAWIMLFWFGLRYWQLNQGRLNLTLREEVKTEQNNTLLIWYLRAKTGKPHRVQNGFVIRSLNKPRNGHWESQIALVEGGREGDNGEWVEFKKIDGETFKINDFVGFFLRLWVITCLAFKKPGIGSWFLPYALFCSAVVSGLFSAL
ncbi:MAG: hypothetical protein AB2747_05850 [Candidatus Thiodiazotropha taylori]